MLKMNIHKVLLTPKVEALRAFSSISDLKVKLQNLKSNYEICKKIAHFF